MADKKSPQDPQEPEDKSRSNTPDEREKQGDWVDKAVEVGGFFGMNKVRLQWRLRRWQESRQNEPPPVDREEHPRASEEFAQRHGSGTISNSLANVSASMVLAILIFACFVRTFALSKNLWTFDVQSLCNIGANLKFGYVVYWKQYWRWGTSVFLHGGLLHLGFNLYALMLLGPYIEEIYSRSRMLIFFMVTGFAASAFSSWWHAKGFIGIGASGAIMGLAGVAAGWGQRDNSFRGRQIRNLTLQWLGYTVVFGMFVNGDNPAHISGFVLGGVLGFFLYPFSQGKRWKPGPITLILAALSAVAVLGFVYLIFFPLSGATCRFGR